ncbi:MAG: hypothetical protein A2Z34_06490 [Planctomycetes bacterium RBG_16_59_8]|nr:MAG: hypothetical protein A2Z34_06490 [Planctomycetes bacterium RBG_16_59_8]
MDGKETDNKATSATGVIRRNQPMAKTLPSGNHYTFMTKKIHRSLQKKRKTLPSRRLDIDTRLIEGYDNAMRSEWRLLFAAALSCFLTAGCTISLTLRDSIPLPELRREGYIVIPKPVQQPQGEKYDCGPEVAVAILDYWRTPLTLPEATRALKTDQHQGTPSPALLLFLREKGLVAEPRKGTLGVVKNAVDSGKPPIIMLEVSSQPKIFANPFNLERVYHFFIVVGYNDSRRTIVCAAPEGRGYEISYAVLDDAWKSAGHFLCDIRLPDAADFFRMGEEAESRGENDRAIALYRKVLELRPDDAASLLGIGNLLLAGGKKEAALEAYLRAQKSSPADPKILNNLANLYGEAGTNLDEALRLSEEAVRLYREELDAIRRRIPPTQSTSEGKEAQRTLRAKETELAYALGTLGQIRSRKGDHLKAIAAWQSSLETAPLSLTDFRARRWYEIGLAHREMRNDARAREALTNAANIVKDPALKTRIREALAPISAPR